MDQIPADPTLSEDDEEYAISLLLHLFNVFIETCGKIPIWNCSKDLSNVHSGFLIVVLVAVNKKKMFFLNESIY